MSIRLPRGPLALLPGWDGEPGAAPATESGAVTVVAIDGPIAHRGWETTWDAIAAAVEATQGPVVLRVSSPGGTVAGCEQAIARIQRATQGRSVVAYADELCCSAAYWLAACVADSIVAPASAEVCSIGVWAPIVDEHRSAEQAGIDVRLVRVPRGKDAGNSLDPLPQFAAALATSCARAYERMRAAIIEARPWVTDAQIDALDGASIGAEDAYGVGLVDEIGGLDVALQIAAGGRPAGDRPMAQTTAAPGAPSEIRAQDAPPPAETAPAEAPPETAPEPSEETGNKTITCPQCGAELIIDSSGEVIGTPLGSEPVEAAAASALMRATGRTTLAAAVAEAQTWRARVATLEVVARAWQAEQAAREREERKAILAAGVRDRRLMPADAWADDGSPREPWASMALPALREWGSRKVDAAATVPAPVAAGKPGISPELCRKYGLDPERVAKGIARDKGDVR